MKTSVAVGLGLAALCACGTPQVSSTSGDESSSGSGAAQTTVEDPTQVPDTDPIQTVTSETDADPTGSSTGALFNDWLWATYAPVDAVEGSPTFGQTLPRNAANEADAYKRWAAATWAGTRAQMRRWKRERDKAVIVEPTVPE